MSTKFTRGAASESTPLNVLLETAREWIERTILAQLPGLGFTGITAPHLRLFSNLACGVTSASDVARAMGITRQAVNKTVKEMEAEGYLTLAPDPERRNAKNIVMTARGGALAIAARELLAEAEAQLAGKVGDAAYRQFAQVLRADWGATAGD